MVPALLGAGRMAMQALPYITATYGALEGAKEGGLMGALTGGGLGYFGGKLGTAPLRGLTKQAINIAPGAASALGIKGTPLMAKAIAGGAIPIAGAALAAPLVGSLAGKTAQAAVNAPGALLGTAGKAVGTGETIRGYYDRKTNTFVPDQTDPLGGTGLPTGPQTALDYLNPLSGYQGQLSLQQQQQDVALKGAVNAMNAMRPYLEESKSRDFRRNVAAARLGTDLATQQALIEGGQRIAGTMGTQALGEVGAGLRTQYRYL